MAYTCEKCGREFSTEEGLAQHGRDSHGVGKVTKHELRKIKKVEREHQKIFDERKRSRSKIIKYGGIAIGIVVILGIVVFAVSSLPKSGQTSKYDLSGIPSSFVHWHADVDVILCGEEQRLPEAAAGGLIGSSRLHTHDRAANIVSLPGSDGNGVIHTEGNIPSAPQEHTLGRFMSHVGIKFSETEIMGKRNGDTCDEGQGTVKILLNGQPLENPIDYLPRDRDIISVEFS